MIKGFFLMFISIPHIDLSQFAANVEKETLIWVIIILLILLLEY